DAPQIAARPLPGRFVMLKPGAGVDPLLRRPFSVFEILRDATSTAIAITILSKRVGPSTRLIYDADAGDTIDCLGPLRRPFTVVQPPTEAWMIAGGVGVARVATLEEALRARGVKTMLFYGARRAAELFYLDMFRALDVELVLTTEDGSAGERGRVVAPLDRRLAAPGAKAAVMLQGSGPGGVVLGTSASAVKRGRQWPRR